jgi:hypothetical protein
MLAYLVLLPARRATRLGIASGGAATVRPVAVFADPVPRTRGREGSIELLRRLGQG